MEPAGQLTLFGNVPSRAGRVGREMVPGLSVGVSGMVFHPPEVPALAKRQWRHRHRWPAEPLQPETALCRPEIQCCEEDIKNAGQPASWQPHPEVWPCSLILLRFCRCRLRHSYSGSLDSIYSLLSVSVLIPSLFSSSLALWLSGSLALWFSRPTARFASPPTSGLFALHAGTSSPASASLSSLLSRSRSLRYFFFFLRLFLLLDSPPPLRHFLFAPLLLLSGRLFP